MTQRSRKYYSNILENQNGKQSASALCILQKILEIYIVALCTMACYRCYRAVSLLSKEAKA